MAFDQANTILPVGRRKAGQLFFQVRNWLHGQLGNFSVLAHYQLVVGKLGSCFLKCITVYMVNLGGMLPFQQQSL